MRRHLNPNASRKDSRGGPPIEKDSRKDIEQKKAAKILEALKATVAQGEHKENTKAEGLLDAYGHGHPFDRLQFGYSPAVTPEAVAFHSRIDAKEWVALRSEMYRRCILKRQKLTRANCEPLTSMFKVKDHWKKTMTSSCRTSQVGDPMNVEEMEKFLAFLEGDEENQPSKKHRPE